VTVRTVAVIAYNPDSELDELLFWEAVDPPAVLAADDVFTLSNLKFALRTLRND
jgi:hypothetical protein